MAKRRSKSGRVLPDGVSERADGRFIYRYTLHGKPHYIYDRDLNELKKKIVQSKIDIASGVDVDLAKITLHEWYPQYVKIYKEGKVKDTTLCNYNNYYNWYVKGSVIDKMPMRDVKRIQVVALFQELATKKGLAHGTLRSVASMLFNAFEQALDDGIVNRNPATRLLKDVMAEPKEVRESLTQEEEKLLIEFLKREGEWQHIYLPVVALGLSTGLRYGELCGLTWSDINFTNRVISIDHSINYRNRGNGHEYFVTTPKTYNSIRTFPMTEEIMQLFEMQKKYQKDMRIRQDVMIDGYSKFIFTTKTGKPFTHEGFVKILDRIVLRANEWEEKRAAEEGREPVVIPRHTPHVWRHTFCTRLVQNDIPAEKAKILMGHGNIRVTLDTYTHINKQNEKMSRIDLEGIISVL